MSKPIVPNFGELLGPYISAVPPQAVPNFLALLERGAAQRYRDWAEQLPNYSDGLLKCAEGEDEIANIIEAMFLIDDEMAQEIQKPLPDARDTYYQVFEQYSLADQLAIQADAELQGANAWRNMLSNDNPVQIQEGLLKCIDLEESSSKYLYSIIDSVRSSQAQ